MPSKHDSKASREAAKLLICEILAVNGGSLPGKVRLNKAFYLAHLYAWRATATPLTDYPIVRLPHGPAINDLTDLLNELRAEGRMEIATVPNGPFDEYVYRLTESAWPVEPDPERQRAIQSAVEFVRERTAAELSTLMHEHSRSWQAVKDGQEMDIYLDIADQDELDTIREHVEAVRAREGEIWEPAF